MALMEENSGNGMVMPVSPMGYSGNNDGFGFGGAGFFWMLLLFLLVGGNGWGNGFGGGNYGNAMADSYPWFNQNNIINGGFRDQMIAGKIDTIGSNIVSGFGDVQNSLCTGFAGVNASIANAQSGIAQQMYANQMADMERSFAAQTAATQNAFNLQSQLANCCCENRAATADLKYTVATENCADRTQSMQNTRDIIDAQTRGTQAILDKLCALELDGVRSDLAQAQRENVALQNQLNMANLAASQTAQTARILQGQTAEVDALYNRLSTCPVNTVPVYGSQPVFSCNGGCSCNA